MNPLQTCIKGVVGSVDFRYTYMWVEYTRTGSTEFGSQLIFTPKFSNENTLLVNFL